MKWEKKWVGSQCLDLLFQADSDRFAEKAVGRRWEREGSMGTWSVRGERWFAGPSRKLNHLTLSLSLRVCRGGAGDGKMNSGGGGCGADDDDGGGGGGCDVCEISQCDLFDVL